MYMHTGLPDGGEGEGDGDREGEGDGEGDGEGEGDGDGVSSSGQFPVTLLMILNIIKLYTNWLLIIIKNNL